MSAVIPKDVAVNCAKDFPSESIPTLLDEGQPEEINPQEVFIPEDDLIQPE